MTHVFHRQAQPTPPVAVAGEGPYVLDASGRRYLDASGGAAVSCLGHSDGAVRAAMKAQIDSIAYAHTGFFTSWAAEALADELIGGAPPGMARIYYTSGGSEAVETALKMARQYFVETGRPERRRFIARRQSYHGNTLGALSVGGNSMRRAPFDPLLMPAAHIEPCNLYRDRLPDESEEAYGIRVADELEHALLGLGPETVAGFVCETVVGATGGVVPPARGYFKRVREICDRHGILFIADEVMCGMGRCGTLHAIDQEGAAPDLMCVAKGLAAGYQPIGAVFVSSRVFGAFGQRGAAFLNGHTFMGHPVACAAALATQRTIRERDLLANVRAMGVLLRDGLRSRLADHPYVGDIRGRGLFIGVELVADRATKAPFAPTARLHAAIKARAMDNGLICYPGGGTVDGVGGDHVLLAPPYIVTAEHVAEIVDRLSRSIDQAIDGIA